MASLRKSLAAVVSGTSDQNIRFSELCRVMRALGFEQRIEGSHHIYWRHGVREIVNLQPLPGGKSKAYQVKQVRQIITAYHLTLAESR